MIQLLSNFFGAFKEFFGFTNKETDLKNTEAMKERDEAQKENDQDDIDIKNIKERNLDAVRRDGS